MYILGKVMARYGKLRYLADWREIKMEKLYRMYYDLTQEINELRVDIMANYDEEKVRLHDIKIDQLQAVEKLIKCMRDYEVKFNDYGC